MVLLDILAKRVTGYRLQVTEKKQKNSNLQPLAANLELIVAHFNHGIRPDSGKDEESVHTRAKQLGLPFEVGYGHLGKSTSEATARQARYDFLEKTRVKHQASAIITAHHQDDLLETAILNLLRGTGYRGLVAISTNKKVIRPLLRCSKKTILDYAQKNNVEWREDSSNRDDIYLRNYVRFNVMPKLTLEQRNKFICNIDKVAKIDEKLHQQIAKLSHYINNNSEIDRSKFSALPMDLANELLAYWLRDVGIELDKRIIDRLNMALRTSKAGTKHPVKNDLTISLNQRSAQFINSL